MTRKQSDKTTSKPATRHQWDEKDRVILAVLEKFYDVSKNETAVIFTAILSDREGGLSVYPTPGAITAQINELRRVPRGANFRKILSMSLVEARQDFRTQRERIETAAQAVGITLKLRLHPTIAENPVSSKLKLPARQDESVSDSDEDLITGSGPGGVERNPDATKRRPPDILKSRKQGVSRLLTAGRKRRRRSSTARTTLTNSSFFTTDSNSSGSYASNTDSDPENDAYFRCPSESAFAETSTRIPRLLQINFNKKGKWAEQRPRLLFRAFEATHGLRARSFLETSDITPLPPYGCDEFRTIFHRHLSEDMTYQSPLLSFTQSPRRALDLIRKSNQPRYLAILDFIETEEGIRQTLGTNAGPWLVPELCKDLGFNDLQKTNFHAVNGTESKKEGYKGYGEWLIHGALVVDEIVAILDYDQALQLYNTMKSDLGLNYHSGRLQLGDVQSKYREVVARSLMISFKIFGRDKDEYHPDYQAFVAGVYDEPLDPALGAISSKSVETTMKKTPYVEISRSISNATVKASKGQITVEIPAPVSQISRTTEPTHRYSTGQASTTEEDLQALVDSQLSVMGSRFGVSTEPSYDAIHYSESQLRRSMSRTPNTDTVSEYQQPSSDIPSEDAIGADDDEATVKMEFESARPAVEGRTGDQDPVYTTSPAPSFGVFTRELLESAMIPTPTPPPQRKPNQVTAEAKSELLGEELPCQSPDLTRHPANNSRQKAAKEESYATEFLTKKCPSSAQSPLPNILQEKNGLSTTSKDVNRKARISTLPHDGKAKMTQCPAKLSPSVPPTIHLTGAEILTQTVQSRSMGAPRKMKAPETLAEFQKQTDQAKIKLREHEGPVGPTSDKREPGINKHFNKISKPRLAPVGLSARDEKQEIIEDDELEIISETIRSQHSSHTRTTTRRETKTVLTVRSRSATEGLTNSRKK